MELCTTHCTPSIPQLPLSFNHIPPFKTPHLRFSHFPGVVCDRKSKVIRASLDENKSDKVATFEDGINDVRLDTVVPPNPNEAKSGVFDDDDNDFSSGSGDDTLQTLQELLNNFNIQLDAEDTPTILLYGGGALVAVWLLSAIVGAIDSIPVLPKLLEVVGLGYSVWFTTRYLLFKKNREELVSKIEELKQEILGSND